MVVVAVVAVVAAVAAEGIFWVGRLDGLKWICEGYSIFFVFIFQSAYVPTRPPMNS